MDRKNKPDVKLSDEDTFFDSESVVSATECTGLIQTPPSSVDEAESYGKIYDIPHTEEKVNNGFQSILKSKSGVPQTPPESDIHSAQNGSTKDTDPTL